MSLLATILSSALKVIVIGNSMLYYGGMVRNGEQRCPDEGMLSAVLKADAPGYEVYDCTYGGHHLQDFSAAGCGWEERHGKAGEPQRAVSGCAGVGTDLLEGLDLASFDCVFISEAGNNFESFYDDALAVFQRFRDVNPGVRCFYVNHIYSVFKNHRNILDNLKKLHDEAGVTIINCGQMAYDIYTGALELPGGRLHFVDRYTFVNHLPKDGHHPNPLMGYIMTQMCRCALTGKSVSCRNPKAMMEECRYAGGNAEYSEYYLKYYSEPAALPFTDVVASRRDLRAIERLIPLYINKF